MLETTEILGNLGNFVGAIGVVGSLVYLAIQVRHSREATNANTRALDDARRLALAQTYQARSAALQESALFVAGSADFSEIYTRFNDPSMPRAAAAAAFEQLSAAERFRCYNYLNAHRVRLDNLVFQYQQGMLTDEYYATGVKGPLRYFAPLWEITGLRHDIMRPSFVEVVREALSDVAAE